MKPIASPLRIVDFAITNFDFNLVPVQGDKPPIDYFEDYDLDIDFDMSRNDILRVIIHVQVNKSEVELPGYSLSATAACFFETVKDNNMTDAERSSVEGFSTIYIALNSIRGLISNFTANAPYGKYILPSIDLNDLIQKKKISLQEAATAKKEEGISTKKKKTKKKD